MCNGCTDSHIRTELGDNLRAGKPWKTNHSELLLVEHEVLVEDQSLLEAGAVLVEELLREEWEVLPIPRIEMVGCTKGNHAEDRSGVEGQLCRKRGEERTHGASTGSDVVPVKAKREHSQALVTSSTTEDARKPGALLIGKAENADTSQSAVKKFSESSLYKWIDVRGNVLREPLPNKDTNEHRPEELDAFLLHEDLLATMESVE